MDNTMSQKLFFWGKEYETLVHMAKTRVWYAIPDCFSTELALLWAILNLSYTDFCWCKFGHRALKTGSHPGRKQSLLSVCWRACGDQCCLWSRRCWVGKRTKIGPGLWGEGGKKERKKKELNPLKRKSLFDSLATRDIHNPAKSSQE